MCQNNPERELKEKWGCLSLSPMGLFRCAHLLCAKVRSSVLQRPLKTKTRILVQHPFVTQDSHFNDCEQCVESIVNIQSSER